MRYEKKSLVKMKKINYNVNVLNKDTDYE